MNLQLIGVDGGASGVRAYPFEPETWRSLGQGSERAFGPESDRLVALAGVIGEVAIPGLPLILGVAAPGLKTPDGRGILRMRHGPAQPDLLDRLQARLEAGGLPVAALPPLLGDGQAGTLGEAAAGSLKGTRTGYYLGAGTGLAEGVWWEGKALGLEELGMARAWELGLEDRLAARGLKERYATRGAEPDLARGALAGDPVASEILAEAVEVMLGLLRRRAGELEERGYRLERAVLGQRFSAFFCAPLAERFARPLAQALEGEFQVVGSDFRAAPGLGAAVTAWRDYRSGVSRGWPCSPADT